MRLLMRREVNLNDLENKPVELSELEPLQRVVVGFRMWWRNGSIYRSMNEKNANKELKRKLKLIDDVKEVIILKLSKELKNKRSVELCIDRVYLDIIDDIFSSPEFISYNIKRIYENQDILRCFPDLPLRFRFEVL